MAAATAAKPSTAIPPTVAPTARPPTVRLSDRPLVLEGAAATAADTYTFYDHVTRRVVTVRRDMDIRVISLDGSPDVALKIGNRGTVLGASLSLDRKILGVQRSPQSLLRGGGGTRTQEFVRVNDCFAFTVQLKSSRSSTVILGFHWIGELDVMVITNAGAEVFELILERGTWRSVKTLAQTTTWYTYSGDLRILVLASGTSTTTLQPYFLKRDKDRFDKLPKFTVDLPAGEDTTGSGGGGPSIAGGVASVGAARPNKITSADVRIVSLYRTIYMVHINSGLARPVMTLYVITRETSGKKGVIPVDVRAPFLLNTIDNLLILHSLGSKVSSVYDIRAARNPLPIAPALPAAMASLAIPATDASFTPYAPDWFAFGNDLVVSRQLGLVWTVQLSLSSLMTGYADKAELLDTLLRRRFSKQLVLEYLRTSVEEGEKLSLVATLFDQLNAVCQAAAQSKESGTAGAAMTAGPPAASAAVAPSGTLPRVGAAPRLAPGASVSLARRASGVTLDLDSSMSGLDLAGSLPSGDVFRPSTPTNGAVPGLGAAVRPRSPASTVDALKSVQEALNALPQAGKALPRSGSFGANQQLEDTSTVTAVVSAPPRKEVFSPEGQLVIDQQDLYTWVFCPMIENKNLTFKYKVAILTEYIRSLNQVQLNVYHYIYELVINLLVSNNRCYQLHQLMQYHVVRDSDHVACLLLSLVPIYPPAYQLAIDMLKRLGTLEDIVEVLLLKSQVITAIRFIRSHDLQTRVRASLFLESALATNDRTLFYSVFKFFEARNVFLYNTVDFPAQENCGRFVAQFEEWFPDEAKLSTAVRVLAARAPPSATLK